MRNLDKYIIEKLQLNKDIKVEGSIMELAQDENYISTLNSKNILRIPFAKNYSEEIRDKEKMTEYKNKGSKPERLVNSIKDYAKLLRRFKIAINMKWYDCVEVFGNAIIERGYASKEAVCIYIHNTYEF